MGINRSKLNVTTLESDVTTLESQITPITASTSEPSGGNDGDIWLTYTP